MENKIQEKTGIWKPIIEVRNKCLDHTVLNRGKNYYETRKGMQNNLCIKQGSSGRSSRSYKWRYIYYHERNLWSHVSGNFSESMDTEE